MLPDRNRFRLRVHAGRALDVQDMIRDGPGAAEWFAKVRVVVDVDPVRLPLISLDTTSRRVPICQLASPDRTIGGS